MRRRQRRLRARPRGGQRSGRAGPRQRRRSISPLQQRHDERRAERVARGGAVDGVDRRRLCPCDLLAGLEQHRALGAERERDQTLVGGSDRLVLVPVDDQQVGLVLERAARRGCIQAEEPRARGGHGDRLGLDLVLADHGVGVADVDLVGLRAGGWPRGRSRSCSRPSRRRGRTRRRSHRRRGPRR